MKKLLILAVCAAMPAAVSAEQWQVLGTRPMGMGGAFVAVAQGPIAQYWNPGGLVKSSANVSGMEIPVGVNAEFTGDIIKNASSIGDLATQFSALQEAQKTGAKTDADQMGAFVKTLALMGDMNKPGKGALAEVAGGANFKFSKVALSINNFTSIGLTPEIDVRNIGLDAIAGTAGSGVTFNATVSAPVNPDPAYANAATAIANAMTVTDYNNIATLICGGTTCGSVTNKTELANALVNQAIANGVSGAEITAAASNITANIGAASPIIAAAASGNSYTNNTSALNIAGASFTEIAAGYAWNVDKWLNGLSLGANLKMINGQTVANRFQFLSQSDTGEAFKMDNPKSSWRPAVDLGLLWNVRSKYPRAPLSPKVGLVMRNINSPSFDTNGAGKYDLDRQVRLGFALNPAKFWTLALDMDLTKNKTPVDGFDSRQLAMGTEINIVNRKAFNIPLRAGLIKNMAEKDSKMAYTLGTGLNLLFMHFDISGLVSSQKTKMDDKDIPTKVGVAASFGLLF